MLLAIDIGNTSVSFALFDKDRNPDELVVSSKISTQKNRSADEYAVLIKQILDLKLGSDYSIDCSAVSSVVPTVTASVLSAAEILSGSKPYLIRPGIKTDFKISVNDPATLGSDIVSNVAAALEIAEPPLVIFDAGTANTITVIDEQRSLIGTVIMPGIRIASAALHENAELLDSVSVSSSELPIIGKNTEESVRSGLIHGNSLMLDGFVRNIRESFTAKDSANKLSLIATGGFSELITDHCRNKFFTDTSLTLRGVAALFYKNLKKQ